MSRKIPRALEPAGIVLLDKPAGISSFAAIAELRRTTGARTGHAGTLDPFATGLLVVLSGSATRLAQSFVKLDKRYLHRDRPDRDDLDRRSRGRRRGDARRAGTGGARGAAEALRGEIELPIPAASAVKIDGERAYRLHRKGVAVEMPLRRSRVDALDVVGSTGETVTLDLRVSSGTYIRAIAEALGGHCRTLRRTEVGPFSVEEAGPSVIPSDEALARLA